MFDEISTALSLQHILTDLHVKPIGVSQSDWLKEHFKVDSGACGNLMSLGMYKSLYSKEPLPSTINHPVHLLDYNKQEIKQLGTCKVLVKFGTITKPVHFCIVSDRLKPILGVSDALNLRLTSFHYPVYNNWHDRQKIDSIRSVDSINSSLRTDLHSTNATCTDMFPPNLTKECIINHLKYAHLFRGIGRFKCNPVHITTKQNGVPIQKPPRKVPIVMHEQFKKELDSMEDQGIISKFDGWDISPEWLNSFVKLHDAKYFAVFDTSKGFFHVPLDQESKLLMAMLTPFGIDVYNMLTMGLSNATDLFETYIREILDGLAGVTNIADDVLIFGRTETEFKTNVISFLTQVCRAGYASES